MTIPVNVTEQDSTLIVNQKQHQLTLLLTTSSTAPNTLVCHFQADHEDLNAEVAAPTNKPLFLAKRIVSFLSAYVRIQDPDLLEGEVLRWIERHNRSANSKPSNNV